MLVLVVNLASGSFRYRLLEVNRISDDLAAGSYSGIGQPGSPFATHVEVAEDVLRRIERSPEAIGFKAAHGGPISGAVRVNDQTIATIEQFADVGGDQAAILIAVMRLLRQRLPNVPQVTVFETSFHQTIPWARQVYAIPFRWTEELGIRRYGFHGVAHRAVTSRLAERLPTAKLVISCHLGDSSSVCAIDHGKSAANSFGMTVCSGLPQASQVGDIDPFALQRLLKNGLSLADICHTLRRESGLLGMSGVSSDIRHLERAATEGNSRAQLAIDSYVESIRHYLGASLVVLGGCQALVFSGEIGMNCPAIRQAICRNLAWAGMELDLNKNNTRGSEEKISTVESNAEIWVLPADEDAIVAKQTAAALTEIAN